MPMYATDDTLRRLTAASIAIGAMLAVPQTQAGELDGGSCGARSRVVAGLEQVFGERQQGLELAAQGTLMELFASSEEGTWTLLRSMPDGQSCIVASGRGALPESVLPSSPAAFAL